MKTNEFPQDRVQLMLAVAPQAFTLREFAMLYRSRYGHADAKRPFNNFRWKALEHRLNAAGCRRVGEWLHDLTRYVQTPTAASFSPPPAVHKPSPLTPPAEPSRPASTIERMEAKLLELQRVLELQQKIKEVEAQIELF